MFKSSKLLISAAIVTVIVLLLQLIYVFVLPKAVNISDKIPEIEKIVKEQANADIKITNPSLKTFADFSFEVKADKIDLKSSDKNLLCGENVLIKIQPLSLIFRKITIKDFEIQNLFVNITRYDEKVFGLGDSLKFDFDSDTKIKVSKANLNVTNYSLSLDDRYAAKKIFLKGDNFDVISLNKRLLSVITSGNISSEGKILDYNLDLTGDFLSEGKNNLKNFVINGYIKNINLKSIEPYLKSIPNVETSEGIINLQFVTSENKLKPNLIAINADLDNIAINKGFFEKQLLIKDKNSVKTKLSFEKDDLTMYLLFDGKDLHTSVSGEIINYSDKKPKLALDVDISSARAETVVNMLPFGICKEINLIKKYGISGDVKGSFKLKGDALEPDIFGAVEGTDLHALRNIEDTHTGKLALLFKGKKADIVLDLITKTRQTFNMTGIIDIYDKDWSTFKVKTSDKVELPLVRAILVPVSEIFDFLVGPLPVAQITSGIGNAELDIKGMKRLAYINGKVNLNNMSGGFDGLNALLTKVNAVLDFQYDKMTFSASEFLVNSFPADLIGKGNMEHGTFDFSIKADDVDSSIIRDIVRKSDMLEDIEVQMKQVGKLSGLSDIVVNVAGKVEDDFDFSKIDINQFKSDGFVNLKNNRVKLTPFTYPLERVSGKINFNNDGIDFTNLKFGIGKDSNGIASGKMKINSDKNSAMEIKITSPLMYLSDTVNYVMNSDYAVKSNITAYNLKDFSAKHSLEFFGIINNDDIDLKSVNANIKILGKADNKSKNYISSGDINVKNNSAHIKNLKIKADNSEMLLAGNISSLTSKNPFYKLRIIAKNFAVNSAADFVKSGILGENPVNYSKSCKDYKGNFDADIELSNNGFLGQILFRNLGFRNIKTDIPVFFPKINIKMTNSKIILSKITGEIGRTGKMPVFIDVVINNYMKIPYVQGKIMGRLNSVFVERYINTKMQQPLKLTGNIDFASDINGSADSLRVMTNAVIHPDSDISYMSVNLGDSDSLREFIVDAYIHPSNTILKKFEYIKYDNNQIKASARPMFTASGNFANKDLTPKNFIFETKQDLPAKMLNFVFKKSLIKNGTFNAALRYSTQNYTTGKATGIINVYNAEIPLYGAVIKDTKIKLNENNINVISSGNLINTDYKLDANIINSIQLPLRVKNFAVHTKYINLDNCLKTVNKWSIDAYMNSSLKSNVDFDISDIIIDKGNLKIDTLDFKSVPMNNLNSNISLDVNSVLKVKVDDLTMAGGKVFSDINYNIKNGKTTVNLKADGVDSNIIAESFLGLKNQIKGNFNGNINFSTKGFDSLEQIENLNGNVTFNINDGNMPKLGSLEYLLHATNLIKSGLTALSVNGVIELLNPFKDGSFEKINGHFDIQKGVVKNMEIFSQGSHLSIYLKGKYGITDNNADITVYGKFGRKIDGLLGNVGNLSLNTFFNMIPLSKDSTEFEGEIAKIPDVTYKSDDYRVFKADINGNINENNAVNSFRWLK